MKVNSADYFIMPPIIFPELSDESAYQISEYLQSVVQAFDGHYFSQIRRYLKGLEEAEKRAVKYEWATCDDDEDPF